MCKMAVVVLFELIFFEKFLRALSKSPLQQGFYLIFFKGDNIFDGIAGKIVLSHTERSIQCFKTCIQSLQIGRRIGCNAHIYLVEKTKSVSVPVKEMQIGTGEYRAVMCFCPLIEFFILLVD